MALELAQEILNDFHHCLNMLNRVTSERDFRVLCTAAASLNRSVGYALSHDPDSIVRDVSADLYKEWKSDPDCIFNTFIVKYRNRVLHDAELDLEMGAPLCVIDTESDIVEMFDNDFLYVPYLDQYTDWDIRDCFEESFTWWCEQLRTKYSRANSLRPNKIKGSY